MPDETRLTIVKLLHSVVWAFFVACIVGIPLTAAIGAFGWTGTLTALMLFECVVLAFNHGRCPLTDIAARYTTNRADNFDIFLPLWLARHNKLIFGTLFVAGEIFAIYRWLA